MSERRKLLLPVLLGVIAVAFVGDKVYQGLYAQPLREKRNRQQALSDELHQTKIDIKLAEQKLPQLDDFQVRSLPYEIELAISGYRGWLFGVIEEVGLKRTSVDSGQPIRVGKIYDRLTFSVRGSGSLEQVTQFMHRFYSAGHLHKIRSVTFNPTATGRVDLSLSVEALALTTATSRDSLTSDSATRLASGEEADYAIVSRRNVFSAAGNSWLSSTHLAAITKNADGSFQAWLNAAGSTSTLIVEVGQQANVLGHAIEFVSATNETAMLKIEGDELQVRIGQSLADAVR